VNRLLATVAIVIALASASARALQQTMLLGYGSTKGGCGAWAAESQNSVVDYIYSSWVLGYISAINRWVPGVSTDITQSMPNVSVLTWAKNWCRDHPLEQVGSAAVELAVEFTGTTPAGTQAPATRARPTAPAVRSMLRPPDELR
jgi:hypothetical protein